MEHTADFKDLKIDVDGKHLPTRDGSKSSVGCSDVTVKANLFRMELDRDMTIYKYRVDIMKIRKEKQTDLTKGMKSDVASQHRRRACRSIFEDAMKKMEKSGTRLVDDKYSYVYDSANILYSASSINSPTGENKIIINMNMEDISSEFTKIYVGNQCEEIIVTIESTLQFVYSIVNDLDKHRETQQFLEVLTSAMLIKNGDHIVFGNKFYAKSSQNDVHIGEGKVIKGGFEKSIRIGDDKGKPLAYLQLDAKKSPFFKNNTIVNFICEFLNLRSSSDIERLEGDALRRINSQLKSIVVRTIHTEKSKTKYVQISGLSRECAQDVKFEVDGEEVSLIEFYRRKYNFQVKYKSLPCIIQKGRQSISLFPMDALEIERGQRVNQHKATRKLAEAQIKECRMNPIDMQKYVENAFKECNLRDNKYLQTFKVSIRSGWEAIPGDIMYPPVIKYASSGVEPTRDGTLNWKVSGRERFMKAGVISTLVFIIFDNCADPRDVDHFLDKIFRSARDHGMEVPNQKNIHIERMRSEAADTIEKVFKDLTRESHPYVLCVTKVKVDPVHDLMKSFEARHGVVTQHISLQTLQKAIGNQGAYLVINNLVLKMNPKATGFNHELALSGAFVASNKTVNPKAMDKVFAKNRMIIGLDISHAGPQSFADRALGVAPSEPSVVGMSYSLTGYTHLGGTYWMQAPRLATISDLAKHLATALTNYRIVTHKLPNDIVVYRGGVSEGEFDKVIMEIAEMKKAFSMLNEALYCPAITCIVVMTNSNFRMITNKIEPRARPMEQNVYPGTVINSGVTNPFYNEFILVSQKGIMGTVRPTRCVIVVAETGSTGIPLTNDDAQQLTYCLAYGHQVVAASTTLPVPLTAAVNLSKRGRNNWKEINFRDADARSALSGSSGDNGAFRNTGATDFFDTLSAEVHSVLNHHFWA